MKKLLIVALAMGFLLVLVSGAYAALPPPLTSTLFQGANNAGSVTSTVSLVSPGLWQFQFVVDNTNLLNISGAQVPAHTWSVGTGPAVASDITNITASGPSGTWNGLFTGSSIVWAAAPGSGIAIGSNETFSYDSALPPAQLALGSMSDGGGSAQGDVYAPVPEPSSLVVLGSSMVGMMGYFLRRRRQIKGMS